MSIGIHGEVLFLSAWFV